MSSTNQPLGPVQVGAVINDVMVDLTSGGSFDLGTQITGASGQKFVFVQASEALALADAVVITSAGIASKATKTLVDKGYMVGFVPPMNTGVTSITSGYYFWAQVSGAGSVNCITGSTSSVSPVYTTASSGALGTSSAGQSLVRGIFFTAANTSGATASRAAVFNNPQSAAF